MQSEIEKAANRQVHEHDDMHRRQAQSDDVIDVEFEVKED